MQIYQANLSQESGLRLVSPCDTENTKIAVQLNPVYNAVDWVMEVG